METDYVRQRSVVLQIVPRVIVGDELQARIRRKMDSFSQMKLPVRVKLPNVTLWVIGSIVTLGLVVFGKLWFGPRASVSENRAYSLRYDLAFGTFAMGVVYVLLMGLDVLSFVWATTAFVVASGLFLTGFDRRKMLPVMELALALSFGLHFVFTQLFAIELP